MRFKSSGSIKVHGRLIWLDDTFFDQDFRDWMRKEKRTFNW